MLETLIVAAIYLCIVVLAVWVFLWVLSTLGVALPPRVIQIIWIIVALIALLYLIRAVLGSGVRLL